MANQTCALCGLPLPRPPVQRTMLDQDLQFCCPGCATVYEVAQKNGLLTQALAPSAQRQGTLGGLLRPGETVYFTLQGMWCDGCALVAQRILCNQPGVVAAEVSYAAERGYLRYDPAQTEPEAALELLDGLGYHATLTADVLEERAERREGRMLWQLFIALGLGMNVMGLYLNQLYHYYAAGQFGSTYVRGLQYLVWLLATPVIFLGGISFPRGAWRALRARTATMDTLVTLGLFSAYGYSAYVALTGRGQTYFDSVVMVVTFVTLGRSLEMLGSGQARKDIRRLFRLQPSQAWRREGESWRQVPARSLAAGDLVLVKPGERVPADGEIIAGEAAIDEALLTGESSPVNKKAGDAAFAGTLASDGALTLRVAKPPRETRLAQITHLVQETLSSRPPIQRLVDRASAYLATTVIAAAVLTAFVRGAIGQAPGQALLAAVAVLVVACPCALGLATPLALTIVLGRAAREGILVRSPAALETAMQTQRIVLDKTGTLTRGRMSLVLAAVAPGSDLTAQGLLFLAAAVEQFSGHPIARAIVDALPGPPVAAEGFQAVQGLGASALVFGPEERQVRIGSRLFMPAAPPPALEAAAQAHTERGETVVWAGCGQAVVGFIALRDAPNPTAQAALAKLGALGIRTVLLSGDNPRTVRAIASELGIREYEGNCTPADKAARIQAWQKAGERVAMAGDGVNDAPALATANLSVTVAGGTDIAGGISDVLLTSPDLTLIPSLITLSRRTRHIIRLNLGWALAYNLITIPLAAFGLISPAIAAATMAASSLLVVGNSLRLRR